MFIKEAIILAESTIDKLSQRFLFDFSSLRMTLIVLINNKINHKLSKKDILRNSLKNIIEIIHIIFFTRKTSIKCFSRKYIFVVDHYRDSFFLMFDDLINRFEQNETIVVTTDYKIYRKIKNTYGWNVLFINSHSLISIKDIRFALKASNLIFSQNITYSFFEKIIVIGNVLKMLSYDSFYENKLVNASGVIALTNTQLSEYLAIRYANLRSVDTFTIQHGIANYSDFPIISNIYFIWNEKTKEICINEYQTPSNRLRISGNALIDNSSIKHIDSKKFTISYIATNYGKKENKQLFTMFTQIKHLNNIRIIIKLRPNSSKDIVRLYENWVFKHKLKNFEIVINEPIERVLQASDLLVTFTSGVPIDALYFNVPSIILDIFRHINLKNLINHYDDFIVVKDRSEYLDMVAAFINNKIKSTHLVALHNYTHSLIGKESISYVETVIKSRSGDV
jgi:hypothetical protein